MKMLILLFLTLNFTASVYAVEITVLTEEYAPFNYEENGKVTGFSTEIVEALMEKTKIYPVGGKIEMYPWKRAYRRALEEKNVLIYTMTRTKKRENVFKWVGPIFPREVWLFKLKGRNEIKSDTLEEVKKHMTGVTDGVASTEELLRLGFTKGENLEVVPSNLVNYRKFVNGRVDFMPTSELEMAFRLRNDGKSYAMVEKAYLLSGGLFYYLAFSKETDDRVVEQFQKAFEIIEQDGTLDKIKSRYLN
ncbi:MAG: transporter substrate-binding domain-containing protein [SAR324 cluster bacterium]|nr:transporter substrate-binding domain-containing protein [SAR324 cluster bacterium]